ncbi:RodZ domain-containing protein [Thiocapsa sp.]|uniref:RodZ domain-containing protein n=1 Tax=Thiocapsa sp. TaxID=2024551 RepID=UPI0025D5D368|nr:RodZ domain-containing protein [Thiocapsa sp.]
MTNQTQSTDPNDQNVVEFGDSPGRRLRVQRQSRGLAIERIAAQLHLKPEVIEALEQDRFDLLPDPVFITGYLRNYARALGLDPAPLIAAYQAHAENTDAVAPSRHMSGSGSSSGSDLDSGGTRILVRLISFALAASVIAVIALWWHDRPDVAPEIETETAEFEPDSIALEPASESVDASASEAGAESADLRDRPRTDFPETSEPSPAEPPETTPQQTPAALALPASVPDAELTSEALSRPVPETAPGPAVDPPSQAQTEARDQAPSDPQVDTPVLAPSAAAQKGIVLEFTGPSWLEVRNAAGERLIVGEMTAGDRREVIGQGPFRFTVGRVNNSSMTVDGKPFDLESRSRGNVARFSLDPEAPE